MTAFQVLQPSGRLVDDDVVLPSRLPSTGPALPAPRPLILDVLEAQPRRGRRRARGDAVGSGEYLLDAARAPAPDADLRGVESRVAARWRERGRLCGVSL